MTRMLHDWVAEAAHRAPHARAVVGEDATLTYGALEERSNRVAHMLHGLGCRRGDRVALFAPTTARALANVVGVLKAGCAYVPIDPAAGAVRRAQALRRSDPRAILFSACDPALLDDLRHRGAVNGARTGWLDAIPTGVRADVTSADIDLAPSHAPPFGRGSDDVAAFLVPDGTGSDRAPVPVTHRNLAAVVAWAVEDFGLGPSDRISGHNELASGLSKLETWAAFASGAELHHVPAWLHRLPHEAPAFIAERGLTLWLSVPSQLAYVARFGGLEGRALPTLRHVVWSGFTLPTPVLLHWKRRLPTTTFTRLYAPRSTELAVSHHRVPADFDDELALVPIGSGLRGGEILVLAEGLTPVEPGGVGDIYVRGSAVVPRLRRRADGPQRAFVTERGAEPVFRTGDRGRVDADGTVTLLEPAGLRVTGDAGPSSTEVENAVLQLEEVAACMVIPLPDADPSPSGVACAYVPRNGRPLRAATARERLSAHLPTDAIPTRWLLLHELPVDRSGRIDRARARALLGG